MSVCSKCTTLVLLACLAPACGSNSQGRSPADAASAADGGQERDAGQAHDAGQASDSGSAGDAASHAEVCPVERYTACGGELSGTFLFAGLCPEKPEDVPCESPFDGEPACTGGSNAVSCRLVADGSLTFAAGEVRVQRSAVVAAHYTFSAECLAAIRPEASDAQARCSALSRPPALGCSFADGLCQCLGQTSPETLDETLPYTVSGTNLTLGGELTASYCVEGETLTLDFDPHPASWRYWVLTR